MHINAKINKNSIENKRRLWINRNKKERINWAKSRIKFYKKNSDIVINVKKQKTKQIVDLIINKI